MEKDPLRYLAIPGSRVLAVDVTAQSVPPRFEVVTIRINRSGVGRPVPPRIVPATGQVTITNATVSSLIQDAYGRQLAAHWRPSSRPHSVVRYWIAPG